jgi:hypothetical protein
METHKNDLETEAHEDDGEHGHGGDRVKKVEITVDRKKKKLQPGTYAVGDFKELVGVAPDRELDILRNGALEPLDEAGHVTIAGGEVFVSHARTGGSS